MSDKHRKKDKDSDLNQQPAQEDSGDKLDLEMDKETAKSFNIMNNIRAENRRQQEEEEEKEQEAQRVRAAKEEAWQKAHAERLRREKIEMMKLRQGAMEDRELTAPEPVVKKEYTFKEKWDNYWFHYKKLTFGLAFVALLVSYFVYDIVTAIQPDVTVLFVSSCAPEMQVGYDRVEELLEFCSDDYNGDGEVSVQVMYMPIMANKQSTQSAQNLQADITRFMGEIQGGQSMLIFADKEIYADMEMEGLFDDGTELFPNDPNAQVLGYNLYDTNFATLANISSELKEDLFLGIRTLEGARAEKAKFQEIYANSLATMTRFVEAVNGRTEMPAEFTAISIPEDPYGLG